MSKETIFKPFFPTALMHEEHPSWTVVKNEMVRETQICKGKSFKKYYNIFHKTLVVWMFFSRINITLFFKMMLNVPSVNPPLKLLVRYFLNLQNKLFFQMSQQISSNLH